MTSAPLGGRSPATLFLELYGEASGWTASQRALAEMPDPSFDDLCKEMARTDEAGTADEQLRALIRGKRCSAAQERGRVLATMRVLDQLFYDVHPRALIDVRSAVDANLLPKWLRDARATRQISGSYVERDGLRLIPRGPLLRMPRDPHASSGDLLADRFAALSVVPTSADHDGRAIGLTIRIVDEDAVAGVPGTGSAGAERIGFAALASVSGELTARQVDRGGSAFAAYGPAPGFDAGKAALEALRSFGSIDLAVMPELALTEAHADALVNAIQGSATPLARVVVAGTYATRAVEDGQPWNESRILNAAGAELWRQRKLWPAGVRQSTALGYGLPDPGPDVLVLEDNASGSELVVADIDAFGRCVVLICQDLESQNLATQVIVGYQPDWVITPVFDCSMQEGRWVHARAFSLSSLSQARFLAVTNMAFFTSGAGDPGMGVAVGPKEPTDGTADVRRAVIVVRRPDPPDAPRAIVQWRDGDWRQSSLAADPARR